MPEHFHVESMPPPPDLADIVAEFWQFKPRGTASYLPTQMFPSLCVRIRFLIRETGVETLVYGPSLSSNRKGLYFANDESFMVTLHPAGIFSIFGADAPDLFSRRLKMKTVLANITDEAEDRLAGATSFHHRAQIVSTFLRAYRRVQQNEGLLEAALVEFETTPRSVSAIAADLGVSRRTLQRKFTGLGVSPKSAARVVRIQQSVQSLTKTRQQADQSLLSFADQSHFIREFKALVGATPGEFVSSLSHLADLSNPAWTKLTPIAYAFGYPDQTLYE